MAVYGLMMKGYNGDYKPNRYDKDMQEIIGKKGEEGILIDRSDIPYFFDNSKIKMSVVYSAIRIFNNYCRNQWPYSGGYMEQLYDVYRVTQLFEGEWSGQ